VKASYSVDISTPNIIVGIEKKRIMGLFRCCRSEEAIDKDAHKRPNNARAKRDDFDEDLKAVAWMRERANERSNEKYVKENINEGEKLKKALSVDCSIIEDCNSASLDPETPSTTAEQILEDLQSGFFDFKKNKPEIQENEAIKGIRPQKLDGLSQSVKRNQSKISPYTASHIKESPPFSKKLGDDRICNVRGNDCYVLDENTLSFDSLPCVEVTYDIESATNERYLATKHSINRFMIEKQSSLSKADMEFLLKLFNAKQNKDFNLGAWISESEVTLKRLMSKYDLRDDYIRIESSSKRDHSTSIDRLMATSSASGEGIEATLDKQLSYKKEKKSKIGDPPESDIADIAELICEDECDDLKDSTYPILGADNVKNRLLKVRLMEALRGFLPYAIAEQNFWLKFSLERDGSSLKTFLHNMRGSKPCLIVIQAQGDGSHLFGSFTSSEWKFQPDWFGTGQGFLFKKTRSLEVYPYTGSDDMVQYCSTKMIAIGGGDWKEKSPFGKGEEKGIGLLIDGDLEGGESHSCATFCNPCLSSKKEFSIVNMEVWTLTPCNTQAEAENLERQKLFVEENIR
jgi:TLD